MCTLIVLDRVVPGLPLLVASNRDEYLSRPAAPPTRISPGEAGAPAFVAPQDLEAGGSWMGLNERGLFVGLTNRPIEERRADRRSRGMLVLDALRRARAEDVAVEMRREPGDRYNPFNLLAADGRSTWVSAARDGGIETRALEPGLHVLCNRDVNDPAVPKVARIQRELERLDLAAPFGRLFEALAALLASHDPDEQPLESVCVHTGGYGTRSSSIWAIGERSWRLWFSDGAPCANKYLDYTRLLDGLRQNREERSEN
jgi:uncharacterized protein with NRDE domain